MIELYLSKFDETSESEQAAKLYARVSYKETLSVQDMAHHMAEHNTMFSEGSITGILILTTFSFPSCASSCSCGRHPPSSAAARA